MDLVIVHEKVCVPTGSPFDVTGLRIDEDRLETKMRGKRKAWVGNGYLERNIIREHNLFVGVNLFWNSGRSDYSFGFLVAC